MEELIKDYILGLLRWQETKLKCINLGWTSNKEIKAEVIEEKYNSTEIGENIIVLECKGLLGIEKVVFK